MRVQVPIYATRAAAAHILIWKHVHKEMADTTDRADLSNAVRQYLIKNRVGIYNVCGGDCAIGPE